MGSISSRYGSRPVTPVVAKPGAKGAKGAAGTAGAAGAQGEPGTGGGAETTVEIADSATVEPDCTYNNNFQINTQASGTLTFDPPIGTPAIMRKLLLRITLENDQDVVFDAVYKPSIDLALPIGLRGGFRHYIGFIWNELKSTWDILAYNRDFEE